MNLALSNIESEQLAQTLKASADALRLEILRVLRHHSFGVLELVEIFDVKQSALSHHLKLLAAANLVSTRKEGNFVFYRRAPIKQGLADDLLREQLFKTVDQLSIVEREEAIETILTRRTENSQAFFAKHAGQFSEVSDLIAGYQHYSDSVQTLLENLPWPKQAIGLEVGPAEGGFLTTLAEHCEHVYALDISPEMLELAKNWSTHNGLNQIEFVQADPKAAAQQQIRSDFVAFNMVLHHIPSPGEVIKDTYDLVNPGGYLLITELCPHDQDWVRASCGDFWLGIEPDELTEWCLDAGFKQHDKLILALKNGFQVQVQIFNKP